MPRFAANLAYLFTERPLLERFGAAAAAGFKAVELQAPYDQPPRRSRPRSTSMADAAWHQHPSAAGPAIPGLGACRAASATGTSCSSRRSTTPSRSAAARSTAWPARCRRSSGRRRRRTFIANLTRAADLRRRQERHVADRADQPARPAELFPHPRRAGRRHHRQGRQAERENPVRFLSCADRAAAISSRRFEKHLPLIGHVQIAAVPSRAEPDEGEINYPARVRRARPARLGGLDRLRIQAPRPHRGWPRLGRGLMVWARAA